MSKNGFALLLIILVLQLLGLPLFSCYKVWQAHQEGSAEAQSSEKKTEYLTFSIENPAQIQKVGKKECIIDGNLYDIVKIQEKDNRWILTVYPDKKEQKWYQALTGHYKTTENNAVSVTAFHFLPLFYTNPVQSNGLLASSQSNEIIRSKTHFYSSFLISAPTPPPQKTQD